MDRIASNPGIMVGKPCVRGTRLTVECILEYLAVVGSVDEVVKLYPQIEAEDVRAAIAYTARAAG